MADALVSVNQRLYGKDIANVLGFSNVQEDSTWLQEFADSIAATYTANVTGALVNDWSSDGITVSFIAGDQISYSVQVGYTGGPIVGTSNDQGLPTTNALLITLNYVGPRPNRGRVYFGGLPEGSQVDSQWSPSTVNAFENLVQDWVNGIGPSGQLAFLRIFRRPSDVFPTYTSNPVDLVSFSLTPATQRRRRLETG